MRYSCAWPCFRLVVLVVHVTMHKHEYNHKPSFDEDNHPFVEQLAVHPNFTPYPPFHPVVSPTTLFVQLKSFCPGPIFRASALAR